MPTGLRQQQWHAGARRLLATPSYGSEYHKHAHLDLCLQGELLVEHELVRLPLAVQELPVVDVRLLMAERHAAGGATHPGLRQTERNTDDDASIKSPTPWPLELPGGQIHSRKKMLSGQLDLKTGICSLAGG